MDKEDKNDYRITIECSDNGGYVASVMDMDEPSEDKKYTFSSIDELISKVRSLLGDEEAEEESEVPTSREEVRQHLHAKNIGSTASEMNTRRY